jgi:hypothetical protein
VPEQWCSGSQRGEVRYLIGQYHQGEDRSGSGWHNAPVTVPPAGYQPGPPQPYPPAYQAPYQPVPARPRRALWVGGLLAGVLFLFAAALMVWGSFERIESFSQSRDGEPRESWSTWWESTTIRGSTEDDYPSFGIILVVAAAAMLLAAVLVLTVLRSRRPGPVTGARIGSALSAGLAAGAVLILLMQGLAFLDTFDDLGVDEGQSISFDLGLGIWLPGAAVVLGLIGLALTLTGRRLSMGRMEPETPRFGVPMPYGAPPPGYQQPGQFPMSQPFPAQQPASQPFPAQQPVSQPIPATQEPPTQPPAPAPVERPQDQSPEPEQQPAEPPADETQRTTNQGEQPRN